MNRRTITIVSVAAVIITITVCVTVYKLIELDRRQPQPVYGGGK